MSDFKKFWGNLDLTELKKAVVEVPGAQKEYNGNKEIKLDAIQFNDGGMAISIYDVASKKRYKIGMLRPSKFDDKPKGQQSMSNNNGDFTF